MAFDPNNPFALPDPFGGLGISPAQSATAPQQALPPLSPQDEQSLLEKIGSVGLGGLSWLGGMLNKPGRVVRGLLGGKPREALNLIPFSDALGITRPEDEVRGQDLIGAPHDTSFLSPEGIAGFGVDVLTDPLTYLSLGGSALSKLGQTAKRAGVLPKSTAGRLAGVGGSEAYTLAKAAAPAEYATNPIFAAADVAGQRLGGHVGVGIPGGGNAATFDLGPLGRALGAGVAQGASYIPGGTAALDIAGRIGAGAKDLYNRTIPPLFEASVMGAKTPEFQAANRGVTEAIPGATAAARTSGMEYAKRAVEAGLPDQAGGDLIRHLMEVPHGDPLALAKDIGAFTPEQVLAAKGIAQDMSGDLSSILQRKTAGGRPAPELANQLIKQGSGEGTQLGFAHRQKTELEPKTFGDWWRSKSPQLDQEHFRKDWTDGLTTHSLNTMATEDLSPAKNAALWSQDKLAEISQMNPEQQIQKTIMDKYLGGQKLEQKIADLQDAVTADRAAHNMVDTVPELSQNLTAAQAEYTAIKKQAADLAQMKVAGTLPQFLNHPIVDYVSKVTKENINFLKQDAHYGALAKSAVAAGEDTLPVMEALARAWNPTETAGASLTDRAGNLIGHTAPQGAQINMAKALGTTVDKLDQFHVPAEVVKDMQGLARARTYAGLEEFTKIWDSITNLTKAGQTMFPATVVRNMAQDVFNKVVYGMHDPAYSVLNPMRYIKPIQDWMKIANGGTVEGLAKKLEQNPIFRNIGDDTAAAEKLRELYTAWDVGQKGAKRTAVGLGSEEVTGTAKLGKGLESLLPVSGAQGPLPAYIGGFKEGSLNPKDYLKVSGVAGQTEDIVAPVKAMRAANAASDSMMRGSSWYAKLLQGNAPEEAFRDMMKAHYDFANMSQFERGVMRRVLPFYNWARQNVPAVVQEIAELPGGKLATAVKATVAMKGEHPGFVPAYIGEGVAAPLGGEENGQQRFLTHLGLGFEDIGQLAGPGGPLGMLNPLIKAPIEAATGKQLFTGRDLRDLHSRLGDITGEPLPALENIGMNSPVGRILSSAGTLADPRKSALDKAVNLLSGARIADVDIEKARKSAVLDYIREALRGPGISRFEDINVRRENLPQLSPLEQQLYQLYRSQQARRPALPSL